MRLFISCVTLLLLAWPAASLGQSPNEPPVVPGARAADQQQKLTPHDRLYVEDGGAHGSVLESIVVPPKAKAPFTLILETTWVRPFYEGGGITTANKRKIARDADGRIYMERWWLAPPKEQDRSQMTTIQISDPVAHTHINCFMMDPRKPCEMTTFEPSPETVYDFFGPKSSGRTVDEMSDTEWIDLGKQLNAGVETIGKRVISRFNPDVFGNDRVMTIEREFWYSPALGFNMLSKRTDPRYGTQTFTVTNLILSDPDPQFVRAASRIHLARQAQTRPTRKLITAETQSQSKRFLAEHISVLRLLSVSPATLRLCVIFSRSQ